MYEIKNLKIAYYVERLIGLDQFSTAIALIFFINYRTYTYENYFMYISIIYLGSTVFQLFFSCFNDFFSKKQLIVIGKITYITGWVLAIYSEDYIFLYFSALVISLGQGIQANNYSAFVFELFKNDRSLENHEKDVFKVSNIFLLTNALFIYIGGLLAEVSLIIPMIADIFLLLLSLLVAILLLPNIPPKERISYEAIKNITNNIKIVKTITNLKKHLTSSLLSISLFAIMVAMVSRVGFNIYQPLLLDLDIDLEGISIVIALSSIVGGVIGIGSQKLFLNKNKFYPYYFFSLLLTLICCIAFYINTFYLVLLAIICHQFFRSIVSAASGFYINTLLEDGGERIQYFAALSVFNNLIISIVLLTVGNLMTWGYQPYVIITFVHVVALAIFLLLIKKVPNLKYP